MEPSSPSSPGQVHPNPPASVSPDVAALAAKRDELQSLYEEVQRLEARVERNGEKQSNPFGNIPIPVYAHMVTLENDLKAAQREVVALTEDKKAFERLIRSKEGTILTLTTEMNSVKDKSLRIEQDLRDLNTEHRKSVEELEALRKIAHLSHLASRPRPDSPQRDSRSDSAPSSTDAQSNNTSSNTNSNTNTHTNTLSTPSARRSASASTPSRSKSVSSSAISLVTAEVGSVPAETIDRLVALTNELQWKNQRIETLEGELKQRDRLLKKRETDLGKLDSDIRNSQSEQYRITELQNEIRRQQSQLEEVNEQNRLLKNIQRLKTTALEKVTRDLAEKTDVSERLEELRREVRAQAELTRQAEEARVRIEKDLLARDKEIARLQSDHQIRLAQTSMEWEKKTMAKEITRLNTEREERMKTIAAQEKRIAALKGQIASITAVLRDQRAYAKNPDLPLSPNGTSLLNTSLNSSALGLSTTMTSTTTTTGAGDDESENAGGVGGASVDVVVFETVQRDVDLLRNTLRSKESLLQEKDAALEALEHRVSVLQTAAENERKVARRLRSEMTGEVERLQRQMEDSQREAEERERVMKKEAFRMKNQLAASARALAQSMHH